MQNIQGKIDKLLIAMRRNGIVYKLNTSQFYSEQQDRVITKMILWIKDPRKDGEEFYSKVELMKYLAERWKEVNGHGETEDG